MKTLPPKTRTRSRLLIGKFGPSDSALAAASGGRLYAARPLTGPRRAALLRTCARAAPLGAIRPQRKHLTLRTRIKRLARRTLCFSKSTAMHELVIGLFINRFEFGLEV